MGLRFVKLSFFFAVIKTLGVKNKGLLNHNNCSFQSSKTILIVFCWSQQSYLDGEMLIIFIYYFPNNNRFNSGSWWDAIIQAL